MNTVGQIKIDESNKKCGIYKITSPTGRVYIGESVDIHDRWYKYKLLNCKTQRRLYNSILKYGVENHIFEIIEECESDDLLCRERFWQDYYDVLNGGLNCKLTECGDLKQVHIQETKDKISRANKGRIVSEETKEKLRVYSGENCFWYGKKHSDETKKHMSMRQVGHKNHSAKLVLHLETGIFYDTAREASEVCGLNISTFYAYISGRIKKESFNYIYV